MIRCYCPECGEIIGGKNDEEDIYCVSVSGLFKTSNPASTKQIELSMLKGFDIDLDNARLAQCEPLKIVSERYEELSSGSDLFMGGEFDSIVANADKVFFAVNGFDLDDPDENVAKYNRLKYVWVFKVIEAIRSQVDKNNRVLDFLLSIDNIKGPLKNIGITLDMKTAFSNRRQKYIFDAITSFADQEQLAKLNTYYVDARKIAEMIDTAETLELNLAPHLCDSASTIGNDGNSYITNIAYSGVGCFKRICPYCGAHVSAYLGLYEQKIVSFVGTPTSGKSTFINAVYAKLRRTSDQLKGISIEFDERDPFALEYNENAERMRKKLAVDKTDVGKYPVLSLCVKDRKNRNSFVYTFVDVPGELFHRDAKIGAADDGQLYFRRMKVMSHSDFMCIVLASEQMTGVRPDEDKANSGAVAGYDSDTLNDFVRKCRTFNDFITRITDESPDQVSNDRIKIVFMVTKADDLDPQNTKNSSGLLNGVSYWAFGGQRTNVTVDDMNQFMEMLKSPDDHYFNEKIGKVKKESLNELSELSHKIVVANTERAESVMSSLLDTFNIEKFDDIPVFFVSSYGFFAVKSVWQLPVRVKLAALYNLNDLNNVSDDIKQRIAELTVEPTDSWLKELLAGYDTGNAVVTGEWLEKKLLNAYVRMHNDDMPLGVNAFLYYIFDSTRLFTNEKEDVLNEFQRQMNDIEAKIKGLEAEKAEMMTNPITAFFNKERIREVDQRKSDVENDRYSLKMKILKMKKEMGLEE